MLDWKRFRAAMIAGSSQADLADACEATWGCRSADGSAAFAPPVAQEHAWRLGWAWWAVSSAARNLGRNDERRDALERAATFYAAGNDAKAKYSEAV